MANSIENVSGYLSEMVKRKASDLYLSPGASCLIKIDGVTNELNPNEILDAASVKRYAYQLMNDDNIR